MKSKLVLQKSNENSVHDIEKYIICQKKTKILLSSTENGQQEIIDVANKRRDDIYRRLKNSSLDKLFKYHIINDY